MQKIEKIYDLFAEEAYGNSLECRIDEDIHIEKYRLYISSEMGRIMSSFLDSTEGERQKC